MKTTIAIALLTAATTALATPACAQDEDRNVFEDNSLTIGAGLLARPSYSGSDDIIVSPLPAIRAKIGGIKINPRSGGFAVDLVPDTRGDKINLDFGPKLGVSFNRARRISDPVVKAAGKLDAAVDLGASGGITINRVLHDYDWITFSTDVQWDVAGAYDGMTWTPSVAYATPLNKGTLVTLLASAHHADGKYARYYYSVTPAQSAASGLPEFQAKAGFDKVSLATLVAVDLDGDLLNGGWSLIGVASYSRMLGDGKDTPYTALRGSANQFMGGLGVAYTF